MFTLSKNIADHLYLFSSFLERLKKKMYQKDVSYLQGSDCKYNINPVHIKKLRNTLEKINISIIGPYNKTITKNNIKLTKQIETLKQEISSLKKQLKEEKNIRNNPQITQKYKEDLTEKEKALSILSRLSQKEIELLTEDYVYYLLNYNNLREEQVGKDMATRQQEERRIAKLKRKEAEMQRRQQEQKIRIVAITILILSSFYLLNIIKKRIAHQFERNYPF